MRISYQPPVSGFIVAVGCAAVVAQLLLYAACAYVIYHFISKFW